MAHDLEDRCRGTLLGTAAGDALGLPAEGLSRRRARRLFPGPWRHRLLPGRGMISDDTEHTVFVTQAILAHPADPGAFARRLGRSLRWWFAALPAGVGMATLRSCVRLWLGRSPARSGVFSAGNGPAMRAAPIGVAFAGDPDRLEEYVRRATVISHRDPKALVGARAVARTAAWCVREDRRERPDLDEFVDHLVACGPEDEVWRSAVTTIERVARDGGEVEELAASLGLEKGVTGYIHHTVPVVLHAWYRHFGDFRATVESILDLGGDTDSTGAIAGALAGAVTGESGIPDPWVDGILDWPRGPRLLGRLADHLAVVAAGKGSPGPVPYFVPGVIPRNVLFLIVVLAHGFRRLLPPW